MANKEVLFQAHADALRQNPSYIWNDVKMHIRSSLARFFSSRGANMPSNMDMITDIILKRIRGDEELRKEYETMFQAYIEFDSPSLKKIDKDVASQFVEMIEEMFKGTEKGISMFP